MRTLLLAGMIALSTTTAAMANPGEALPSTLRETKHSQEAAKHAKQAEEKRIEAEQHPVQTKEYHEAKVSEHKHRAQEHEECQGPLSLNTHS
jgi:hypothetical protein